MATEAINQDSKKLLDEVRKGKTRKFVLICKGAKVLSLTVFKKGSASAMAKQAKSEGFRGDAYDGVLAGKGQDVSFQLLKSEGYDKEPTKVLALKSFLQDNTGQKFKPTYDLVDELAPVEEDENETETATARATIDPKAKAALVKALAQFGAAVKKLIGNKPDSKTELLEMMASAKGALDDDDLDRAKTALVRLGARVKALSGASTSDVAPKSTNDKLGQQCALLWRDAKEDLDTQISALQKALRDTNDKDFARVASFGLNGITGKLQVGLRVALTEIDLSDDTKRPAAVKKALDMVNDYARFVSTDKLVKLVDDNPFGVTVEIQKSVGGALTEIEKTLRAA